MSYLVPSYMGSTASNTVNLMVDSETVYDTLTVDDFTVTGTTTNTGSTVNSGSLTVGGVLTTQGGNSVKITSVNTLPYTVLPSDTWVRIGSGATGVLTLGSTALQTVYISLSSGTGAVTMQGSGASYSIRLNGSANTTPVTLYPSTVIMPLCVQVGPPSVYEILGLEGQVATGFSVDGSGNVALKGTATAPLTMFNSSLPIGNTQQFIMGLSNNTNNSCILQFTNIGGSFSATNYTRWLLGGNGFGLTQMTGNAILTKWATLDDGSGNMTIGTGSGGSSGAPGATLTCNTTSATPLQVYNSALATSSSISKLIGINSSSNNAATVTFTNVAGSGSSTNLARFGLTGGNGVTVDGSGNLVVTGSSTLNGALDMNSGVVWKFNQQTTSYSLVSTDNWVNLATNGITLTVPNIAVGQSVLVTSATGVTATLTTAGSLRYHGSLVSSLTIGPNNAVMLLQVVASASPVWMVFAERGSLTDDGTGNITYASQLLSSGANGTFLDTNGNVKFKAAATGSDTWSAINTFGTNTLQISNSTTSATGNVQTNGVLIVKGGMTNTVTGPKTGSTYNVGGFDNLITVSAAALTVNLVNSTGIAGRQFIVANLSAGSITISNGSNNIFVNGAGATTFTQTANTLMTYICVDGVPTYYGK